MKKAVKAIYLSREKNEDHVAFHETVHTILTEAGTEVHNMVKLPALYADKLTNEKEALDYMRASELTRRLDAQDERRSRIFRGFVKVVEGITDHFDPEACEDAIKVQKVLKAYGNINSRGKDAKTAVIDDCVRELFSVAYSNAVKNIALSEWLVTIGKENEKYHRLTMERYDEMAARTSYRMKTCRPETDRVYNAIVNEIENQVLQGATKPGMTECIARLNAVITHFKSKSTGTPGNGSKEPPATEQ